MADLAGEHRRDGSQSAVGDDGGVPLLGADGPEVLREVLNLDEAAIAALAADGVIGAPGG